jgi:DNA gyrase subunit A
MGRATQGVRLITLKGDDEIASVAKIEHDDSEDELQDNVDGTENPDTETSTDEETE